MDCIYTVFMRPRAHMRSARATSRHGFCGLVGRLLRVTCITVNRDASPALYAFFRRDQDGTGFTNKDRAALAGLQ